MSLSCSLTSLTIWPHAVFFKSLATTSKFLILLHDSLHTQQSCGHLKGSQLQMPCCGASAPNDFPGLKHPSFNNSSMHLGTSCWKRACSASLSFIFWIILNIDGPSPHCVFHSFLSGRLSDCHNRRGRHRRSVFTYKIAAGFLGECFFGGTLVSLMLLRVAWNWQWCCLSRKSRQSGHTHNRELKHRNFRDTADW